MVKKTRKDFLILKQFLITHSEQNDLISKIYKILKYHIIVKTKFKKLNTNSSVFPKTV